MKSYRRTSRASGSVFQLCCAFVAIVTSQYSLPGLGSKGAGLPYVANEIIVATLFMVPRLEAVSIRAAVFPCCVLWLPMALVCSSIIPFTPLFMGAESCEKSESLQTFFATFLMYALYGSKKLRKKFGNFHFRQ